MAPSTRHRDPSRGLEGSGSGKRYLLSWVQGCSAGLVGQFVHQGPGVAVRVHGLGYSPDRVTWPHDPHPRRRWDRGGSSAGGGEGTTTGAGQHGLRRGERSRDYEEEDPSSKKTTASVHRSVGATWT